MKTPRPLSIEAVMNNKSPEPSVKKWTGEPPAVCDICSKPITHVFVDGRMASGTWANMCSPCHQSYGVGLGTGRGQKYRKTDIGWVKIKG
jgi:hypothetical protein